MRCVVLHDLVSFYLWGQNVLHQISERLGGPQEAVWVPGKRQSLTLVGNGTTISRLSKLQPNRKME